MGLTESLSQRPCITTVQLTETSIIFYVEFDFTSMLSDRLSATLREQSSSRRQILTALGVVASTSAAGCSDVFPDSGSSSADNVGEVIVRNGTDSPIEIAVRVVDSGDETLFSRVFTVGSQKIISRNGIETIPARIHAFTPNGVSHTWRYDPDLPAGVECEIKDIGLTLNQDHTIDPWYDC
jgi:hypothetical protein